MHLAEGRESAAGVCGGFVLTDEVQRHLFDLAEVFGQDHGLGVFLRGDFGSGKSHFLAALSVRLEGAHGRGGVFERAVFRCAWEQEPPERQGRLGGEGRGPEESAAKWAACAARARWQANRGPGNSCALPTGRGLGVGVIPAARSSLCYTQATRAGGARGVTSRTRRNSTMRHISTLMEVHATLREMFARHRDLVVGLEFRAAQEALATFQLTVQRHIEDEENYVLPRYDSLAAFPTGGRPEYFRSEHRKILEVLRELMAEAEVLAANPKAGRREAHEYLDRESPFLHLLNHHEHREERFLYPEMERLLREEEAGAILDRCALFPMPPP